MAKREIWKSIPGYKGYEASNMGRVRSVDRKILLGNRWGKLGWRKFKGRVLSPGYHEYGYPRVMLGMYAWSEIHCLVMIAFIGPCPSGKEVGHFDGNPLNNNLSNLRYVTKRENYEDSLRHGTAKKGRKFPKWPQ
jgi:hypothetical protein